MGWQDAPPVEETQGWKAAPIIDIGEFRAKAPPSKSLLSESAPTIGSVVGGIGGALTAGPAGALGGTMLGASIGTSAKQIIDRLTGGKQEATGEGGMLEEQLRNVVQQSTYEMLGQGIGKAGGAAVAKLAPTQREGATLAQEMLTQRGGSLSGAQAVDSPTLNLLESIARSGAGGKGRFAALDVKNAAALQAMKDDLIKSISSAPVHDRTAGKLFQEAISKGDVAHHKAAQQLYAVFDRDVGTTAVDASKVSAYGKQLADEFKVIGNVGKTEAGGRLIDQLANVPERLTFADAHLLRSNLLTLSRDIKRSASPDTKAIATASGAIRRIEGAMEEAAQALPQNMFTRYQDISRFYRTGKEAFNNDVVTSLLRANPERVGEELFKVGNVSEIIQARASLRQAMAHEPSVNSKDVYGRLQAGYLNAKLTARGATDKLGETTAQNLLKDLAEAKTDRQFQVMFTADQRNAISEFARTAYLALNNKPKNFGVLTSMIQAGAIGDLALTAAGSSIGTRSPATDLAIIFGPAGLARVLTNPKAVNLMIQGLKLPESAVASPIAVKLVAEFARAVQSGYDASKQ